MPIATITPAKAGVERSAAARAIGRPYDRSLWRP
jgi:hypothetical protein